MDSICKLVPSGPIWVNVFLKGKHFICTTPENAQRIQNAIQEIEAERDEARKELAQEKELKFNDVPDEKPFTEEEIDTAKKRAAVTVANFNFDPPGYSELELLRELERVCHSEDEDIGPVLKKLDALRAESEKPS